MSLRKTVKRANAHAVYQTPDGSWTWYVLKAYSTPKGEAQNQYARWFCDVTSPFVGESGELGDTYVREVKAGGQLIHCTQEWADAYGIAKVTQPTHV